MQVYLVRHTEYLNPGNIFAFHLPFFLSEDGRKKAQKIGSWFKEKQLLHIPIYSSPIVRALQTAEIIASITNSFVTVDKRLEETTSTNMQGVKEPLENSWITDEDDKDRESSNSILHRIINIYHEVLNKNKNFIFVSHREPITLLYYHLIKKDPPKYFGDPKNIDMVIRKGEIVELNVTKDNINSINRITL